MKRHKEADDLASRLTNAATAPLIALESGAGVHKRKGVDTVPVFLRISRRLYERLDEAAIARTREKGRGVTVQQVIIDILERNEP